MAVFAVIIVAVFALWMIQSFIPFGSIFASFVELDAPGLQQLTVGQCFNGARPDPQSEAVTLIDDAQIVECTVPHEAELVAAFDYPLSAASATYPGFDRVSSYAEAECRVRFAGYVGVPSDGTRYGLTYVPPMEFNWAEGDRSVQYLVSPPDGQAFMTGSVRNARR